MEVGSLQSAYYFFQTLQREFSLGGVPSTVLWLIFACLLFFYWFGIRPFNVLKSCGIPHPSVKPFLGNIIEYVKQGNVKFHEKYLPIYGGVYGFYIGRRPVVVVSDPKILEKVLVKDFHQFHNRPSFLGLDRKPMDKGLLLCEYPIWKKVRPAVSPTFSAGKIKQMLEYVEKSVNTYIQILSETSKNGEAVDVFGSFGRLTMEVIMSVAFGMENDFQLKGSEALIQRACCWFKFSPALFIIDIFPMPQFIRTWIKRKIVADSSYFVELLKPVVEERKRKPSERKDFLQLLLNDNKINGELKLDDDEIFASAVTFLLAGYETTSNALAYTLYLLALNQDVQQRLYDEIKDNFNEDGVLYDEIQKLNYLDSVINESLRIYPPAYFTSRLIQNEYEIDSYKFPKGSSLQIPIYFIHHNEQVWKDPEKFDPSRFGGDGKSKINPYHFMPFGYGPRNCIGARFALVEAKLAIIKVLKKFKVEPSSETEIPLQLRFGLTMSPQNGIKLSIKERS